MLDPDTAALFWAQHLDLVPFGHPKAHRSPVDKVGLDCQAIHPELDKDTHVVLDPSAHQLLLGLVRSMHDGEILSLLE